MLVDQVKVGFGDVFWFDQIVGGVCCIVELFEVFSVEYFFQSVGCVDGVVDEYVSYMYVLWIEFGV